MLALAAARLRRRPGRGLLTALGVALAAAALVATLAIRTLAGDLALRQAITDRPPGDRSATVTRSQTTDDLPALDRTARAALARLHTAPDAGADHAARAVRRQGRRVPAGGRRGRAVGRAPDVGPAAEALQRRPLRGAADRPREPDLDPDARHQDRRARRAHRPGRARGHVRPRAGHAGAADVRPGGARPPRAGDPDPAQLRLGRGPRRREALRVAGLGALLRATAEAADDVERSRHGADRARRRPRRRRPPAPAPRRGDCCWSAASWLRCWRRSSRWRRSACATTTRPRGSCSRGAAPPAAQSLRVHGGRGGVAGAGRASCPGSLAGIVGSLAVAAHEDVDGGQLVRDALGGDALVAAARARRGPLAPARRRPPHLRGRRSARASARRDVAAVVLAAVAHPGGVARQCHRGPARRPGRPAAGAVAGAGGRSRRPRGDAARRSRAGGPGADRAVPVGPLARVGVADALRRPARPLATVAFLVAACALAIFATAYRSTLRAGAADQAAFVVPLDARLTHRPEPGAAARRRVDRAVPGARPGRVRDARPAARGRRAHGRHRARPRAAGRARPGRAAADRALPQRSRRPRRWRASLGDDDSRSPARRCRPARPRCASTPPAPRTRGLRDPGAPRRRPGRRHGARADPRGVPRRPVRRTADPRVAERHLGDPAPHRRGRHRGREAPGRDRPQVGDRRAGRAARRST